MKIKGKYNIDYGNGKKDLKYNLNRFFQMFLSRNSFRHFTFPAAPLCTDSANN